MPNLRPDNASVRRSDRLYYCLGAGRRYGANEAIMVVSGVEAQAVERYTCAEAKRSCGSTLLGASRQIYQRTLSEVRVLAYYKCREQQFSRPGSRCGRTGSRRRGTCSGRPD
eukprot:10880515-Heterocapsa_arctica.AAC.1